MKKFLSLVLALVMTMSLVTVSAGAADFTDDSTITYKEAVDVMTAIGVVGGYADGSFNPNGTLTRGAAAKIICNLILGTTAAEALVADAAPYSDVPVDNVFAGYIAYCQKEGIVGGYADGTFRPAATLTGYAFMKMLLGVIGLNAETEGYTGANWSIAVAKRALSNGVKLTSGLEGEFNGTKAVTREEACLYAFNAIKAVPFTYGSTITIGNVTVGAGKAEQDANGDSYYKTVFTKLQPGSASSDAYGRPAHEWKYNKKSIGIYADSPIVSYTEKTKASDIAEDLKDAGYKAVAANFNGTNPFTAASDVKLGDQGQLLEYYGDEDANGDDVVTKVVAINTYIGEVTNIVKDKSSTKDDDRAFTVAGKTIKYVDEQIDNFDEIYAEISKGDYVLYTLNTSKEIETVTIPETIEGKVTKVVSGKATVDGTVYKIAAGVSVGVSAKATTLWLDTYGNIKLSEVKDDKSDVVYVVDTFTETDKWNKTTYFVRVVTADGEIVELETKTAYTIAGRLVTYTTDGDGYATLTQAAKVAAVAANTEIKTSTANIAGKYFADGVKFVYVKDSGSKLKVSVADGVQALKVSGGKEARYVWNDDEEITLVFVTGGADAAASSDLIFAEDGIKDGTMYDLKNNSGDAYNFYINGEAMTEIVTGLGEGFFTYTIDAETGRYTAIAETNSAVATLVKSTIAQDKYVTVGNVCVDFVLADDCAIYDLTDNGMTSLAEIDDLRAEGTMTLKIGVAFDKDEKEVTTLYVWEA